MAPAIRTPDQRLRVFVSSTLEELAPERQAARDAIERLRLTPVLFELGARSLPPAEVYRAYLDESDVFVGIYGVGYGWVGPGMETSGLEDEFRRSTGKPRLIYVKKSVATRDARLAALIEEIENDAAISYKTFDSPESLGELLQDDLAVLLTERFATAEPERVQLRATLPAAVDGFVGRALELRRIEELLDGGTRLITIAGPGGVGKTRLAVEAARRARGRFRDGAAFVPLDVVMEDALVAPTILAALALPADPAADPADALAEHLGERALLLVLDNFEHVVDAAPVVGELLACCADLTVVVTSRSALRIRGEHELRVEPLRVPEPAAGADAVAEADAVRLFTDRARQLEPTFELTTANADDVGALCRRLEGLPLALELAAARIRLLPPSSILERVGAGLDVLAEGTRDVPLRQRSLGATIEWSYDLLDEPERTTLTEASVFRGGWDLSAAENVLGADAAMRLAALLEHSLVKRLPREQARFGMLESIRSFASERLDRTGGETVRRRHATFYLGLVARMTPALYGSGQTAALRTIELENDNLRAAIEWCLADGRPNAIAEVAPGLMHFWWLRGNLDEGLRWMDSVLTSSALTPTNRARALLVRGFLRFWRAPQTGDAGDFAEAAAIFDGAGDRANAALARVPVGTLRAARGERDALDDLEASRGVLIESGDAWGSLLATNGLCWALNVLEADAALSLYDDGVARARAAGVEAELATALGNLARRHLLRGDAEQAQRRLMDALVIVRRLRSKTGTAYYVSAFADLAARRGELELAVRLFAAVGTSVPLFAQDRERTLAQARDALGEGSVAELERLGAELGLEGAAEEALAWGAG